MRWLSTKNLVAIAGVMLFVGGCGMRPLLAPDGKAPALALHPIRQAPTNDGRARFREIVCAVQADHGDAFPNNRDCADILHRLLDEPKGQGRTVPLGKIAGLPSTTVLFVPGIFGECVEDLVTPFSDSYEHLQSLGLQTAFIHLSGRSSSAFNAALIKDALQHEATQKVILVAYSKGASDVIEMLGLYPEMANKIAAVVSISGVIGGTPIADGYARAYATLLEKMPYSKCEPGDGGGVVSLTRAYRSSWLAEHNLPASVRFYSVAAYAQRAEISAPLVGFYDQLAYVDPRSDGQVIYYDAVFPGGTLLGYARADHWAVALPFSSAKSPWPELVDHNRFPRVVLIESILRYIAEDSAMPNRAQSSER